MQAEKGWELLIYRLQVTNFFTEDLTWWINGVCQLLLGIGGFLANCVSISILLRTEMANTFNRLLVLTLYNLVQVKVNCWPKIGYDF